MQERTLWRCFHIFPQKASFIQQVMKIIMQKLVNLFERDIYEIQIDWGRFIVSLIGSSLYFFYRSSLTYLVDLKEL